MPTHVLALARHSTKTALKLKSVLLSTDHVPNAIKHSIETAFGCTVYNHYGMTEMGLGDGVLNFTATMVNDNGHDSLQLEVKIAADRRSMPVIQSITAAVPYAQYFDLRVSSVNAIPPSMAKRTIVDRRNHA